MNTRLLGAFGEQIAARHLREKGYDVLSGNFSSSVGEIDIVVIKDEVISFVEVKTRTSGAMLPPSSAVDFAKQENIRSTAAAYMSKGKLKNEYTFDIVEVIITEDRKVESVNHIINAF